MIVRVAAVLLCGIAAAALIGVLSSSEPDNWVLKSSSAAGMLIVFSPFGLAGILLASRRPRLAWFGYVTTFAAFAAFVLLTRQIWDGSGLLIYSNDWELPTIAFVVALACGQVSLLLAWARSDRLVQGLGFGGSAVIAVLAILIVLEILTEVEIGERVYGVLAILYLLQIALLPLFTLGRGRSSESFS